MLILKKEWLGFIACWILFQRSFANESLLTNRDLWSQKHQLSPQKWLLSFHLKQNHQNTNKWDTCYWIVFPLHSSRQPDIFYEADLVFLLLVLPVLAWSTHRTNILLIWEHYKIAVDRTEALLFALCHLPAVSKIVWGIDFFFFSR